MATLLSMRLLDVLDIALTSYILLRLYILFRKTALFRVIAAIAGLWAFQRISAASGLIVTSWLMQGFIAFTALIIIILFKEDIRRILEVKNLGTILWGIPRRSASTPVEIISETVFELARGATGALLVFPGKDNIEGLIQTGLPWNGTISREMLLSIFWQGNPVHDGAAIIHGDRVKSVGAILPLSKQEGLPSHYGTRHRAALGLTEEADALVVLVSEEQGAVSYTVDGRLRPVMNQTALQRILAGHLGIAQQEEPHPAREKAGMVATALICVVIVAGIWLGFSRGQESLVTLEIPIEYQNRDPALTITQASVDIVKVAVAGPGPIIRSLDRDQIQVTVDLKQAASGAHAIALTADNIAMPPGVILRNVTPSRVDVDLDVTISKKIPVQIDWVGTMPSNLIVPQIVLTPSAVVVTGPERFIRTVETIYTERVPVEKVLNTKGFKAALAIPPALRPAPGEKAEVIVTSTVAPLQNASARSPAAENLTAQ